MIDGFLNLNKPQGWTSHDCVAKVRRLLQMKRVGHGGTLDPAATGVLPVALGRATRLLQYLPTGKAYRAVIRFGVRTATDDLEGDVVYSTPCPELMLDSVKPLLPEFCGTIQQIPPKYSAIQVDGKRLYDLARAGVEVEVPVRTVQVHQIQVLDWQPGDFPELTVAIACGSGTYIRAIARDLGEAVGTGATLAVLERTASCGLPLASSLTLEQLATQAEAQTFVPIAPHLLLQHMASTVLSPSFVTDWYHGKALVLPTAQLHIPDAAMGEEAEVVTDDQPDSASQDGDGRGRNATPMGMSPSSLWVADETGRFLGVGIAKPKPEADNASDVPPNHIRIAPKVVFT